MSHRDDIGISPTPRRQATDGGWAFAVGALLAFVVLLLAPAWASAADLIDAPTVTKTATALLAPSVDETRNLIFGLFIGVMLTASLYLFFIWIILHDRGQVFLMLFLVCLTVNMISANDNLMSQLGFQSQAMISLLRIYSLILSYILSIFFTYYFLEIDAHFPGLRTPLFLLAGLLLLLLLYAVFDQRPVRFALPTLGTLAIAGVLATSLGTLRNRVSGSMTHIIAFSFFLLGGLVEPLYDLGYIVDIEQGKTFANAAFSLAAVLFAIVIAGQFATRQEEKERALEVSNERFALAARGSNEGLFDWNLATNEVFFSEQFKKLLGAPIEHNRKGLKTWVRLIAPADRVTVFRALHGFREHRQATTINFEYRIRRSDGSWRWLHTKAVATRNPFNNQVVRFVGSIGDITARKRGEAELRASETRFRSITEAHPVPVLIVPLQDGPLLYASPGAETLLGMPHGTLLSHKLNRFLTKAAERKELVASMNAGHEVNLREVAITQGDGNSLIVALSARRINYQNQAAMVIGLYDLTERKRAEEQIAKQQEALQQSEKMAALGGLLAGVAHELNNPLSVVVGQATLLIESSQEAKVTTRAEKIFKAADRCSRIVKSFLALARRKPPERKPIDLNATINAALELLNYQFRNENVDVTLDLAPNLPSINGDGDQMTQVFTNLALNAAQAMHDWTGARHLTIRTETQGDKVMVIVRDTGPGIAPAIKPRVFEPFFTTKSGAGGTGVGLALCLNIIETHGGQLQLEDTPGGGATFLVTLPTVTAGSAASSDEAAPPVALPSALNILLVDDEVELAQTLADLLEPDGHRIAIAANGAIALDKLRKDNYDVIVSDLRMPVLDGPGLYAELTKTMPHYVKRILYVTGDTLSPHVQSFLSGTPVPVIEKPYRLADVRRAIGELLNKPAQ